MIQGFAGQTFGIDGALGQMALRRRELQFFNVMIRLGDSRLLGVNDDQFPALNDLLRAVLSGHGHQRAPSGVDAYANDCWLHREYFTPGQAEAVWAFAEVLR